MGNSIEANNTVVTTTQRSSQENYTVEPTMSLLNDANAGKEQTLETNEGLKEFDDILEKVNKDITMEVASLDDIDDVLKSITQDVDSKENCSLEIPRFDLAEISASYYEKVNGDLVENKTAILDKPIDFDKSNDLVANKCTNDMTETTDDLMSITSENSQSKDVADHSKESGKTDSDMGDETTTEVHVDLTKDCPLADLVFDCEGLIANENSHNNELVDKNDNNINNAENQIQNMIDIEIKGPRITTNGNIEASDKNKEKNETTETLVFIDDSDDCGYLSSDFEFITEEEATMDGLIINFRHKSNKRKVCETHKVKAIEAALDQFTGNTKSPKINKIGRTNRKVNTDSDYDWSPESEDDTDDEDIEYPKRKRFNLRQRHTAGGWETKVTNRSKNIQKISETQSTSPGTNNLKISHDRDQKFIDSFVTFLVHNYTHTEQNNKKHRNPDRNSNNGQESSSYSRNQFAPTIQIDRTDESNVLHINYPEPNSKHNTVINDKPDQLNTPDTSGPSQREMQDNAVVNDKPDQLNTPNTSDPLEREMQGNVASHNNNIKQENCLNSTKYIDIEVTNIAAPSHNRSATANDAERNIRESISTPKPGNSAVNVPEKLSMPGPSTMRRMPKMVSRPSTHVDEMERWRMYQIRNRLQRQQFVLDYSYRENHRVLPENDFHQLFEPNRAPLAGRSLRLLENKSIVSKNTMLVAYQGVGFDMQLLRNNNCDDDDDDDDVKREANECVKKIQQMYPAENTKRRRF